MDVAKLLAKPREGITLDELKVELNELAKLREDTRLAFCLRLAMVYLHIVGHRPPAPGWPAKQRSTLKIGAFKKWCADNLRSGTGKLYANSTLTKYVGVGFAQNPEVRLARMRKTSLESNTRAHAAGRALERAIEHPTKVQPPAPVLVKNLKQEHALPHEIAQQVSAIISAWDAACPKARRIALVHLDVAGLRVA